MEVSGPRPLPQSSPGSDQDIRDTCIVTVREWLWVLLYYATVARIKASWERLCSHSFLHTVSERATQEFRSHSNNVDEGDPSSDLGFDILASVDFNNLVDLDFYFVTQIYRYDLLLFDAIICIGLILLCAEIFLWWSTKQEDLKGFPPCGVFSLVLDQFIVSYGCIVVFFVTAYCWSPFLSPFYYSFHLHFHSFYLYCTSFTFYTIPFTAKTPSSYG